MAAAMNGPKPCARCEGKVYPLEQLKCLDKIWHKGCFKCSNPECGMALSMKNYKGYDKFPYCDAHVPKPGFTTIVDTPENKRLADNTAKQSGIAYHSDFEKSKGKFTTVADDPETLRLMQNANTVSNIGYHGMMDHKNQMEASRQPYGDGQDPSQQQQSYIAPYQSSQPAEEPRSSIEYQPAATPSQWKKGFPPNQPPLSASNVSPSNSLGRESSHHSQNGSSSSTRYHNDLQLSVGTMLAKGPSPSSNSSARTTVPASKSSDYRIPSQLMSTPAAERPKVGSLADYDPMGEHRGQPNQQPTSGGYQAPQGQSTQQQQRPQQAAQPPPYQQPQQQQQGAGMQRQTSYGAQPGAGAAPAYGQHQGASAAPGGYQPQQPSQPAYGGAAYGQQNQQNQQSTMYGQSPQAGAYGQQQGPRPSLQTQMSGPKPYSPQPQLAGASSGPKPYSPQSAGAQPYSPSQQSYGQSSQQSSTYGQPSFAQPGPSSYAQPPQQSHQQQQQSKQFTGTNAFSAAYGDAGQHPLHAGGPQPLHSQAQGSSSMYGQQSPQSNTHQPASQNNAYQPAGGQASQFGRQPQQQHQQPSQQYSSPTQGATSWPPSQGQSSQQASKAAPPWLQQQQGGQSAASPPWSGQQGNQTTQQSYSSHTTTTQSHQQQGGRGGPSGPSKSAKEYKAMYDYNAADVDEVSFRDGDVIVNVQPIDAGWMIGTVKRTGKSGMLPSNYVTPA